MSVDKNGHNGCVIVGYSLPCKSVIVSFLLSKCGMDEKFVGTKYSFSKEQKDRYRKVIYGPKPSQKFINISHMNWPKKN